MNYCKSYMNNIVSNSLSAVLYGMTTSMEIIIQLRYVRILR